MSDRPKKPTRMERFTMLEPKGPNNPSPEELATRVVEPLILERFTMLEPKGPNNPSPEELATRVVAAMGGPPMEVPNAVLALVAQLAAALEPLDAGARLAALDYVSAELSRRLAG